MGVGVEERVQRAEGKPGDNDEEDDDEGPGDSHEVGRTGSWVAAVTEVSGCAVEPKAGTRCGVLAQPSMSLRGIFRLCDSGSWAYIESEGTVRGASFKYIRPRGRE